MTGPGETIRLSDVVSALSAALDLTEGQPMGHAVRSCILGMRIAELMQLPAADCSDLYYALLMKDAGCSSNSARMHQILGSDDLRAKREVKFEDWTKPSLSGLQYLLRNVLPGASLARRLVKSVQLGFEQNRNNAEVIGARCERGAEIARKIGLSQASAEAIRGLDEHWSGRGYPEHRKGAEISILSRIMNVSQTLEVFASTRSVAEAVQVVAERGGTWFDPEIVQVVRTLERDTELWKRVQAPDAREYVVQMEPGIAVKASPDRIDNICRAFAEVIDAKSPYTFTHSMGVAEAAVEMSEGLGLKPDVVNMVRRAALLHDVGKLGVSNAILEKPGKLTSEEWQSMKMHPVYTQQILEKIPGFSQLASVAGAHHERLDGTGYPQGLAASQLPLEARIICVADVYQALSERRPYREGLPPKTVFAMLDEDSEKRLDPECLEALKERCPAEPAPKAAGAAAGR
ncbi:MAG TPA: HD domain-containing phosphohydrolase [Terriglobales bacterium]|nr:HD domain-containing phosphohydrolase [Terriglobales bacterium]